MSSLYHLPAPAKLNLFLHVTGRRADGYHLLQSVFMLIDWQDTLHVETRQDGLIRRHDLNLPLPPDDLCLQAARLLKAESGSHLGCDICIHKIVPWGAGLGGGSSDAATVLLALNQLWGLNWPRSRLLALALRIGADVPFFVNGRNAWVEGIGERITPLELPPQLLHTPIALLKPALAVPTSAIFGSTALPRSTASATVDEFMLNPLHYGHNDLQEVAVSYNADKEGSNDIGIALETMRLRFGNSRMTGSGSTVFSWVNADSPAGTVPTSLDNLGLHDKADWIFRTCRGLPTHPLNALLLDN